MLDARQVSDPELPPQWHTSDKCEPEPATDFGKSLLTIVVPCFNERTTILRLLDRVVGLPIDKTVVVVDNASTDGTDGLLRSRCAPAVRRRVRGLRLDLLDDGELLEGNGFWVVLMPDNGGKGRSLKTVLRLADSKYFVCQDADLEYNPEDILRLLQRAQLTGASATFGRRVFDGQSRLDVSHWGRQGISLAFRLLYGASVSDIATCYKLVLTDVARSLDLRADGFDLDFEMAAKFQHWGVIEEIYVSYTGRPAAAGKKLQWRHGFSAMWMLIKHWMPAKCWKRGLGRQFR